MSPSPESRVADRPMSLRARLVGMLALLFLVGTVALYLAAREYAGLAADKSYDRLLAGSVQSIAESLSIDGHEVYVDVPYSALDMLSAAPEDRVFYRVFGADQQTITGYDDLPRGSAPPRSGRRIAFEEPRFFDAHYRGELVRFALLGREIAEPDSVGWVWVQVGQTRRARDALARELVLGAIVPIALITLLAVASVALGISRALEPIHRVGSDLAARRPEDLRPIDEPVPVELAPLIDSINGFMRRLSASIDMLRAFIADAAHQMRTPLAALRAQAGVAAQDDPEELARSLATVQRNAARLSRLLDQLLSDATVSHRSDFRRFETFDLVRLVRECVAEVVPMSMQAKVEVVVDTDQASFFGDSLLLGEALKNLIDNALKHGTAEAQSVTVEIAKVNGMFEISVSDRGPGIPPGERERVFQRFSRGDSRAPGAGLGLSIVRRAVTSHGGEVVLSERPGGGLTATLRLRNRVEATDR